METLFSRLLTQTYELEGLLLVLDKHGEDTPAVVYQRIGELGEQIAQNTAQLSTQTPQSTPQHAEPEAELPERDYDADETWQHDNGEEFTEVFKVDYVEPVPSVEPAPHHILVEPQDEQPTLAKDELPAEDGLRVDEKLQRSLSKDMRKALSLNDRFRFKRELFGNSDVELNNALDLINAMQDYEEAEEYFLTDLDWDQDSEDVADFMGLVRRHFL